MNTEQSHIIRKTNHAGAGALVQFAGLAGGLGTAYFGYRQVIGENGRNLERAKHDIRAEEQMKQSILMWMGLGAVVLITLVVIGRAMSRMLICSSCKNPVASKDVKLCPSCKTSF